jgi:hypothetical protein
VVGHRLLADVQNGCDFFICEAFRDQTNNLHLPRCESRFGKCSSRRKEALDHLRFAICDLRLLGQSLLTTAATMHDIIHRSRPSWRRDPDLLAAGRAVDLAAGVPLVATDILSAEGFSLSFAPRFVRCGQPLF